MFSNDRPITIKREDLLGRGHLADTIANAIVKYKPEGSLTIGITGPWGTGKTSLINMVEQELSTREYSDLDDKPIIIRFNPWNYSDQNQLITQFFNALSHALDISNLKEDLCKVSSVVGKISDISDFAKYIPVLSGVASAVSPFLKDYAKALSLESKEINLSMVKNKISKELSKLKNKIVIIIDDIDRLNNTEIRQVFQLVKSLCDFPNTVYILVYEHQLIVEALKEVQTGDGNAYLEKIIQIPFEMPPLNRIQIRELINRKFNDIVVTGSYTILDQDYGEKVFKDCIYPFVKNIRDVNRLLNLFSFKYYLVQNEVNPFDLLAMVAFEIFLPDVYTWTKSNINWLADNPSFIEVLSFKDKKKEEYKEEIQALSSYPVDTIIDALSIIFPNFSLKLRSNTPVITHQDLLLEKRIASPHRYHLYFSLSPTDISVPHDMMENALYEYNEDEIIALVKEAAECNVLTEFMREVNAGIKNVNTQRIGTLISVFIYRFAQITTYDTYHTLSYGSIRYGTIYPICKILLSHTDPSIRLSIIKECTSIYEKDMAALLVNLLCDDERLYKRLGLSTSSSVDPLFSEKEIIEYEALITKYLKMYNTNNNIFELYYYDLFTALHIWEACDKSVFDILKVNLEDFSNLLKLLYMRMEPIIPSGVHWGNQNKWRCDAVSLCQYYNLEQIYTKLLSIKNKAEFDILSEDMQIRCVSFALWYKENDEGRMDPQNEIMDEHVRKELTTWHKNEHTK